MPVDIFSAFYATAVLGGGMVHIVYWSNSN